MFDKDIWQEIFSTIRKNKLRSFLTGFSVAWGIFMLMVLLGSGRGLQNGVKHQFDAWSENIMWLWTGRTSMPYQGLKEGRPIRFKNDDYHFLKDDAEGIDLVSSRFTIPSQTMFSYKGEYGAFQASACYPELEKMEKIGIPSGRFINYNDINGFRKSVVIGEDIARALFKGEEAVGKYLNIGNIPFLVVGVAKAPEGRESREAYMPFTTAQRLYGGGDRVHTFAITTDMVQTTDEAEAISEGVRQQMARRHSFDPSDRRAMGSFHMLDQYIRTMKIFQAINIFILIIGLGTLIAGVVGVSNIMLILVKERTREIGIRKALGASPASVVGLVLFESILITTLAGYIGLVTGVGLMEGVNSILEAGQSAGGDGNVFFRNPTVDFSTAIGATIVLIVAGAIAGYVPARRAAAVKPIEALRDE
jgi:putative ABC transport system permease protein